MRQLGEMTIKMLGLYYASSALLGIASAIAAFGLPPAGGFPASRELAVFSLAVTVGVAAIAAVCLLRAEAIAGWLFSEDPLTIGALARRDYLFIGISLIGLVWVISGIPDVVQLIARSIWYAEGTRQAMFRQMIGQSAEGALRAILSIAVGVALIVSARTLSMRLDAD